MSLSEEREDLGERRRAVYINLWRPELTGKEPHG
jgi:hypothetical protein